MQQWERELLELFPALNGNPVTEKHARACRESGHLMYIKDGVEQATCPRCGEVK